MKITREMVEAQIAKGLEKFEKLHPGALHPSALAVAKSTLKITEPDDSARGSGYQKDVQNDA